MGRKPPVRGGIRSPLYLTPLSEIIRITADSDSYEEVLEKLDIRASETNKMNLKRLIAVNDIDAYHLKSLTKSDLFKRHYTHEEVFCADSKVSQGVVRGRINKLKLMDTKCVECGLTNYWNGKKIILQLDHINGDHNDNRLKNLRWLCPNCHSQTPTYQVGTGIKSEPRMCLKCKKSVCVKSGSGMCASCVRLESHVTKPDCDRLLGLVREHCTREIAVMFSVNVRTVNRWIRDYKIDPLDVKRYNRWDSPFTDKNGKTIQIETQ